MQRKRIHEEDFIGRPRSAWAIYRRSQTSAKSHNARPSRLETTERKRPLKRTRRPSIGGGMVILLLALCNSAVVRSETTDRGQLASVTTGQTEQSRLSKLR